MGMSRDSGREKIAGSYQSADGRREKRGERIKVKGKRIKRVRCVA
jgi:hypothetical protein